MTRGDRLSPCVACGHRTLDVGNIVGTPEVVEHRTFEIRIGCTIDGSQDGVRRGRTLALFAVSRCISRGARLRKADAEFGAKLEELDQFFAETTETPLENDQTS